MDEAHTIEPEYIFGTMINGPNIQFPDAEELKDFSDYHLWAEFKEAVENGWPEEWIDLVLDEKNRREASWRKSLMMGFEVAVPRNESVFVMANDYSV